MTPPFEGEHDNFADQLVDQATLAILLRAAGWHWDYWGKFYGPGGIKVRDLRWVLEYVKTDWKCPACDCDPGCPCCGVDNCHNDGWTRYSCFARPDHPAHH